MKLILSTVAALVLIGAVAAQPAQAACWWTGYGWQCWESHPHWYWDRDRDDHWRHDRDDR